MIIDGMHCKYCGASLDRDEQAFMQTCHQCDERQRINYYITPRRSYEWRCI